MCRQEAINNNFDRYAHGTKDNRQQQPQIILTINLLSVEVEITCNPRYIRTLLRLACRCF